MNINNNVNKIADDLFRRIPELLPQSENFHSVFFALKKVFSEDKMLYLCGNGGSAADCDHIVGELMKDFRVKRKPAPELRERFERALGSAKLTDVLQVGMRAVSLLSHPGLSSAFANDVDPLYCYAQQLYVLGRSGDAVIGISTSGNAKNICECFQTARGLGITTILLTGENCGICEEYADLKIKAPSGETYRIQEYHLPIYHTLCLMLEMEFYGNK